MLLSTLSQRAAQMVQGSGWYSGATTLLLCMAGWQNICQLPSPLSPIGKGVPDECDGTLPASSRCYELANG